MKTDRINGISTVIVLFLALGFLFLSSTPAYSNTLYQRYWSQDVNGGVSSPINAADLDADGDLEIIANVSLSWDKGKIYVWSLNGSLLSGWPKEMPKISGSPCIGDLDGDGDLEIVVATFNEHRVYAFHHDGELVDGWPQDTAGPKIFFSSPTLGDLDGDGDLEVLIVTSFGYIYAWHHDGTLLPRWGESQYITYDYTPLTLADVDKDGDLEVFSTSLWGPKGCVWGAHHDDKDEDGRIDPLDGWPPEWLDTHPSEVIVGDIDNDRDFEVLVRAGNKVYAWHVEDWDGDGKADLVDGWPQDTGVPMKDPVLADLDGDKDLEIVCPTNEGTVYIWHHDGSNFNGWPKENIGFCPTIGDVDSDNQVEIITIDSTAIYAYNLDGSLVNGWPLQGEGQLSIIKPLLANIDSDNSLEVLAGGSNKVYIWHHNAPFLITPTDQKDVDRGPLLFDWEDLLGATGYGIELLSAPPENPNGTEPSIYRIGAAMSPGGLSEFPGDTSGMAEGTYYWRVIAVGPQGLHGVFSDAWSFVLPLPPRPTLLLPQVQADAGRGPLLFDWEDLLGATGYGIELLNAPPEPWEANTTLPSIHRIGAAMSPGRQSTFLGNTSGLAPGTYWWRIIAVNDSGLYGVFSDAWSFSVPPFPRPILESPIDNQQVGKGPVVFNWSDVEGVSGYGIELLSAPPENPNGTEPSIYRIGAAMSPGGLSEFPGDTSGMAEGTYYWRVIAINPSGLYGVFSDAQCFVIDDSMEDAYLHLNEVMDKYHSLFDVYTDSDAAGNHFPHMAKMTSGDSTAVQMDLSSRINPRYGVTAIECVSRARGTVWGGFYFQNGVLLGDDVAPKENWGDYPNAGFDMRGATRITFWARGKNGGERVEFFAGGVGWATDFLGRSLYPEEQYPDSFPKVSLGYQTLSSEWKMYVINLEDYDLSYVIGGFGWVTNATENNNQDITFYIDDIKYNKGRLDEPRFLLSYETVSSQEDFDIVSKNVAFIYDNALALLAYMRRGNSDDWRRATLIADALVYAQTNDRYFNDGRLRNAYQAGDLKLFPGWTPHGKEDTVRMPGWSDLQEGWVEDKIHVGTHTGNVAWAMISLVTYYQNMGGQEYLEASEQMGEWIETNTKDERGAGGYTGGYEGWETTTNNPDGQTKLLWKSTENNIDLYVVFTRLYEITADYKWNERAEHAKRFVEATWNEDDGHFWTGTLDDGETINTNPIPLDPQTWSVLAFLEEEEYQRAISWAEQNTYCSCESPDFLFEGFDFDNDCDMPWPEGTAQMVVCFDKTGETEKAQKYLIELEELQSLALNSNNKGIVAAPDDGLTTGFDWSYYNRLHIGATSWFIFAEHNYNPFW